MRTKDPELMKRICDIVDEYYRDNHSSPSTSEIAKKIGISKATVYRYLLAMDQSGMITYDGNVIVTKQTDKCKTEYVSVPVVGSIQCGNPEEETEYVEEYVNLPRSIFGSGKFYLLRAKGDSMVDAGIAEGDLILIEKQESAKIGDIVVALDENQENTLKRFAGYHEESGDILLEYCNQKRYPGAKIYVKKLIVQGVARHVIKSLT